MCNSGTLNRVHKISMPCNVRADSNETIGRFLYFDGLISKHLSVHAESAEINEGLSLMA